MGGSPADAHRGRGDGSLGHCCVAGGVVVLYAVLGTGTILALRAMSRRWRTEAIGEEGLPYGPPAGDGEL